MSEAVIEARGLVKHYGQVRAVDGLDLDVTPGEIFGFLGPNGAGKSTTIGMLSTLVRPTSGSALIGGVDVTRDPGGVRARIGMVFQDPSLDGQLTARENLEFHAFLYGLPRDVRRERIAAALAIVDLTERASSQVLTFSGGMKRRLEIARGMLHYPQVLFLDEPTLGLDPQTRASIWTYLKQLRASEGTTIFMTTHYMDEAEFCDRIAIIDRGVIVALGTPEELRSLVGGDVVTVVTDDNQAAAAEIQRAFQLDAAVTGNALTLEVDSGASFVPQLMQALTMPVATVAVARPTLDAVFIKLTGRAIRDESADSQRDMMRNFAQRFGGGRR
ncbi:MAG: ATP-binding cassette domain-containing protein [Candidatus Dormibacteria bacterium]